MKDANTSFDIVVVGAGMVGASFAALLASSDKRVLLIDRQKPTPYQTRDSKDDDSFDLRVSAVNLATQQLLTTIGVWPTILATQACPFRRMEVWDAHGDGRTVFDSVDIAEPHLGHIVENRLINHTLVEHCEAASNIDTLFEVEPEAMSVSDDWAELRLSSGDVIQCRLVVGADGGRSRIRDLASIGTTRHDYQQRTLVALLETELDLSETAWQRFLTTGPIAFLPLGPHRCSLAWHLDRDEAAKIEALDDDAFSRAVTKSSDGVLGNIRVIGPHGGFDLHRIHAREYTRSRVALVGDAAHVVHPLAGLGVNLGFMDAAVLFESVATADDVGDARKLRAYQRRRRLENTLAVAVTDAFKHTFGSSGFTIQRARNLGLNVAQRAGPLKHQVVRYAIGLAGDVPAVARR